MTIRPSVPLRAIPAPRGLPRGMTVLALVSLLLPTAAGRLRGQQDSLRRLEDRVEGLDQRLRVLDRLEELRRDSAMAADRTRPIVTTGADGFTIRSSDGRWRVRLSGYFQADSRWYPTDDAGLLVDGFLIRRARPMVEGTLSKYFDFRIMPDFGSGQPTLYEAWLEARLHPALSVRAGKFKPPVGLERLQSATDLRFIERGFPTNLAPNRDVGVQIGGELAAGAVTYQAGVFNGVPDLGFGDGDANDAKEIATRLFLVPFAARGKAAPIDLGVGLAVSTGRETGTTTAPLTSALRAPGQATFFRYRTGATAAAVVADGRRTRVYPQAYAYRGSWGLLAELSDNKHTVRRDTVTRAFHHTGWQVAGSVFLTGEKASYRSVTPRRPFDPKAGTLGAVEVAFRIQQTEVDDAAFPVFADPTTQAQRASAWGVGVNWYFARQLKLMVNYERTKFRGGSTAGNRPTEAFLATRFQFAY
ncbi:MAG: porin [Gemmatimonadales bacterium]|nr:porin [Gemmatimonadales bacterium]